MAPAACEDEEDLSGVRVAECKEQGGATAVAARIFRAGESVFCERALVIADASTNLARVRAYCRLAPGERAALREQYFAEAPSVRCAATAACRPETGASGDSAREAWEALRREGESWLGLEEVECVVRIFNLNAYDNALAPVACKVNHSCAPNIFVTVDADRGVISAKACRDIASGDVLGSWYFQDTGLWWMGADVRRAIFETDRGFRCACGRCAALDCCRQLPCDACGNGTCCPDGSSGAWHCAACGHNGPGTPARLGAEAELVPRVLLQLRPPKHLARASVEELLALEADATARLGAGHWASAAASLVLHFRGRPPGGALDAFTVGCGCRFLGWLIDRKLPAPPAGIVRTPVSMAIDCAEWLAFRKPLEHEGTDVRCLAARILSDFLLPLFEASGSAVAKVASTGARVEALKKWRKSLRESCGHCSTALCEGSATSFACGRCKQVRYCSKACQLADWKARHKQGCLPATESLAGEAAQCQVARK